MASSWTTEQIIALAPDPSSAKAGRSLAVTSSWVLLGADRRVIWGECRGSGKNPYQTQIDLSEPAFKCSCPSRKSPCKHILGLFLLHAAQPEAFQQRVEPSWVKSWIESRDARAEKKEARSEKRVSEAARLASQEKRQAKHREKVEGGLKDLELWLDDLIRNGLASAQNQPYSFWDRPAARLVDAQAQGLARQLRELAGIPASGARWPERMIEKLGGIHLLLEGYRRIDELPEGTAADIRNLIGWTQKQEEIIGLPGERDSWGVLGRSVEIEDQLRVQRIWLYGITSGRAAVVISFAHSSMPLDLSLMPGCVVEAELVYFPSGYPMRAIVKERVPSVLPLQTMPGYTRISESLDAYADALSCNPWIERFPLPLLGVVPQKIGEGWSLRDSDGQTLPLASDNERLWRLMALSGGHPVDIFGEWDGSRFLPLSVFVGERFISMPGGRKVDESSS